METDQWVPEPRLRGNGVGPQRKKGGPLVKHFSKPGMSLCNGQGVLDA